VTVSKNDTQQTMLCSYAECGILFTIMLNVFMLSVIMLSVLAPEKKLVRGKQPSLFGPTISDELNQFYVIDIRRRRRKRLRLRRMVTTTAPNCKSWCQRHKKLYLSATDAAAK
jgi:hypothetical protein